MSQKYIIETDDMRDVIAFNESKKLLRLFNKLMNGIHNDIVNVLRKYGLKETDRIIIDFLNDVGSTVDKTRKESDALRYNHDGELII